MEKPTELNNHEISNVSGALWANALGAIAGGIGGFYGAFTSLYLTLFAVTRLRRQGSQIDTNPHG